MLNLVFPPKFPSDPWAAHPIYNHHGATVKVRFRKGDGPGDILDRPSGRRVC